MKVGDRVKTNHDFLSEGFIKKIHYSPFQKEPFGYTVKLDEKAPNEYAWETDEVFMFAGDLRIVK